MEAEVINKTSGMVDVVFDLSCASVPQNYAFSLWFEISRLLPWLKEVENAGILPLRGSESGEHILLSKRSKLILRVPVERTADTVELSGKQLHVDGSTLLVGKGKERQLQPATTLHSYMVETSLGEVEFLADMKNKLQEMNISCNLICDKYRNIKGARQTLSGYGLVLHDLKPQASMQIQCSGLGSARQLGCGIFVPFKAITGLE